MCLCVWKVADGRAVVVGLVKLVDATRASVRRGSRDCSVIYATPPARHDRASTDSCVSTSTADEVTLVSSSKPFSHFSLCRFTNSGLDVRRYAPVRYTGTSLVGLKSYRHSFLADCHTGVRLVS